MWWDTWALIISLRCFQIVGVRPVGGNMDYFHRFDALITPSLGAVKPFRRSAEGSCGGFADNCIWSKPSTLKDYYGVGTEDNPFELMDIRGEKGKYWKWTPGGNLRLYEKALTDSGAAKLRVKKGWAVKLAIAIDREDYLIGKPDFMPIVRKEGDASRGLARKCTDCNMVYPTIVRELGCQVEGYNDTPVPPMSAGKEEVTVILNGDTGDYLSVDVESHHSGIADFALKLGDSMYKPRTNLAPGRKHPQADVWIFLKGVCELSPATASGTKQKIEDYRGYTIWRDDSVAPFKIQAKNSLGFVVQTQEYATAAESWGAVNLIKVWIDGQVESQNGGGNGDDGDDGGDSGCPENSTLNATGQCVCDSGFKLDVESQSCKSVESEGLPSYLLVGGLALLGLAILG